jgi:mRNA-degrading endonuclease RelE of RelBE toxin-antitoxin system
MYKVIWGSSAEEDLRKIDRTTARKIRDKVEKYLTKDPHH